MVAAGVIGVAELVLGIGNIVSLMQDDRRSAASAIRFMAATAAATLVFGGLVLRLRSRNPVSWAIAAGVFPGSCAIVLYWFPPAVVVGLFCMVVTMRAVIDALAGREALTSPA